MFVGEGPGADEDAQGLPFVGAAGQLLTKIIEAIQLTRDQVYICNIVKCRPPSNRTPEEDEIAACSPFMFRQVESIRPRVICCLGAVAAQTVLGTKTAVGKLRGRFHDLRGIQVMPTWHPAYLLRNPAAKRDVWDDIRKIKTLLDEVGVMSRYTMDADNAHQSWLALDTAQLFKEIRTLANLVVDESSRDIPLRQCQRLLAAHEADFLE